MVVVEFSLDDVRRSVDASAFSRGYDYYMATASSISKSESLAKGMLHIIAKTQGSKIYTQKINIYDRDEGIKILGSCDCPVGKNCKHIVSALLTHLDEALIAEAVPEKETPIETWLEQLTQSTVPLEARFSTSTVLLYECKPAKNDLDIQLTLYTARVLKGGGYGKVNKARPTALFNDYTPPEYLRPSDRHAVRLFKAMAQNMSVSAVLNGELGAMVLQAAIETKRAFWQKGHTTPLKLGETRPLKSAWQADKDRHRLVLDAGKESYIINTTPAYYIDTKTKSVGVLEHSLTPSQIRLMQEAPAIGEDQLKSVSLSVAKTLPALEIDLPKNLIESVIEGSYPQPILYLDGNSSGHFAKLMFDYKGHELNALSAVSLVETDVGFVKIVRQEGYEKDIVSYLKSYGFEAKEGVFVPRALFNSQERIQAWRALIESTEALESQGVEVVTLKGFSYTFDSVESVEVEVEAKSHWFDVSMQIMIEGEKVPLLPLVSELLKTKTPLDKLPARMEFALTPTHFISMPSSVVRPILKTLYELLEISTDRDNLRLYPYEAGAMSHLSGKSFEVKGANDLHKLSQKLRSIKGIEAVEAPLGLQAQLREYQLEGLAWMAFLREYGFGGILADDMGLGKTVQTLAHLQAEKIAGRMTRPVLIVAPTSLLGNWKREAQKFTPDLRVVISHGGSREKIMEDLTDTDIIITTYTLLANDIEVLKKIPFYYLILDEAQKIKNSRSQAAQAARQIDRNYALALTGTPMENHLGELWSIFEVVMPGLLGSHTLFKTLYQTPIEKQGESKVQEMLNRRIAPFMLRRTKERVATELPPKTEMIRSVRFESEQATLYETIRVTMEEKVQSAIKELGLGRSHLTILDALLKLRQVCCDPRLLNIEEAQKIEKSAKLEMFLELIDELLEEKRRILVFSQFTSMLAIIQKALDARAIKYALLTGATANRDKAIERFTAGEADVFLISLKAGGVGLNLTQADTVIHYDPWWNPAAQDQATDRAYRIGQDRPVFVYKLIIEQSVEEKILAMQEDKKALAQALYEGKEEGLKAFDAESLIGLLGK